MERIILFDGVCRLCNGSVDFVVRRDPKRHFKFASIQSDIAHALLSERGIQFDLENNPTIYLIENDNVYTRSSAALRIAKQLRFPWPLLYVGIIIPPFLRNAVYDFVGARRAKWFGVTNTCEVRDEDKEKDRFLDRDDGIGI